MFASVHIAAQEVALAGSNYTTVVIVALIALSALAVAAYLADLATAVTKECWKSS